MEFAPQVPAEAIASPEPETTYEILSSPETRAEYITLTDGLISRFAENKTDVAIFLDKSARPVAWLVNELWDTLAPKDKQTGETIPKPEIKFLNIDREQWGPFIGRSEDKNSVINVNRIPEANIDDLRQVLAPVSGKGKPTDTSLLSDKNVMVIDEVKSSGDTLHMAEGILKRAFPDATSIDGAYWMLKPVERDARSGAILSGEVPVWYSDRVVTGRLVANRDVHKSNQSNSSRQRAGGLWLSTNFRGHPDEAGRQLKREVKQLAADFIDHKLSYLHSPIWNSELEPLDKRIERLDEIDISQYVKFKKEAPTTAEFINLYEAVKKARLKV